MGDIDWSSWTWNKEYEKWVRVRETSPGKWESDYQVLSGEWSPWTWSESWGQYERAAKDPDGNWKYDHEPPSTDTSKGKSKAKDSAEKSKANEEKDSAGPSDTSKGLLVKTDKAKKRKGVYYFTNEDGKNIETKESDWKKGSRYDGGTEYECLVYFGKKSGKVYHTWQLG